MFLDYDYVANDNPQFAKFKVPTSRCRVMLSKGFRQKDVRDEQGSFIVYLSSVAAFKGNPSSATYAASKGALISLARPLGREFVADKDTGKLYLPRPGTDGYDDEPR